MPQDKLCKDKHGARSTHTPSPTHTHRHRHTHTQAAPAAARTVVCSVPLTGFCRSPPPTLQGAARLQTPHHGWPQRLQKDEEGGHTGRDGPRWSEPAPQCVRAQRSRGRCWLQPRGTTGSTSSGGRGACKLEKRTKGVGLRV